MENCLCVEVRASYNQGKKGADVDYDEWLMSCVRYAWRINLSKAQRVKFICGVVGEKVVACYRVKSVHQITQQDYDRESKYRELLCSFERDSGRCVFEVEPLTVKGIFNGQNPVRYCDIQNVLSGTLDPI